MTDIPMDRQDRKLGSIKGKRLATDKGFSGLIPKNLYQLEERVATGFVNHLLTIDHGHET